ncbi:MAG: hypothetical protein ACRDBX_00455 [Erysipelotrichaceae bacterium]
MSYEKAYMSVLPYKVAITLQPRSTLFQYEDIENHHLYKVSVPRSMSSAEAFALAKEHVESGQVPHFESHPFVMKEIDPELFHIQEEQVVEHLFGEVDEYEEGLEEEIKHGQ